jgi:hypothetical protein
VCEIHELMFLAYIGSNVFAKVIWLQQLVNVKFFEIENDAKKKFIDSRNKRANIKKLIKDVSSKRD